MNPNKSPPLSSCTAGSRMRTSLRLEASPASGPICGTSTWPSVIRPRKFEPGPMQSMVR